MSEGEQTIYVKDLVKDYPVPRLLWAFWRPATTGSHVRALDRVSLDVRKGEVFGLLGPNGAGKTTLIHILATLVTPTSGMVRIAGHDVCTEPAAARRAVGLVTSNERSFYWRLSGRQNLRFFADLYQVEPSESRRWTGELLKALDLEAHADLRFDRYSTGIRQRFAFARALLHRPRILFMDEPTKGLDPAAATNLLRMIRERILAAWRPTILLTSHNLVEVEALCDRVAILHQGRVLRCGTQDELSRGVNTQERYRLTVRGVTRATLDKLRDQPGIEHVAERLREDGSTELHVLRDREGGALSTVLRRILDDGGEVHECTSIPLSLIEVFQHIIDGATEP